MRRINALNSSGWMWLCFIVLGLGVAACGPAATPAPAQPTTAPAAQTQPTVRATAASAQPTSAPAPAPTAAPAVPPIAPLASPTAMPSVATVIPPAATPTTAAVVQPTTAPTTASAPTKTPDAPPTATTSPTTPPTRMSTPTAIPATLTQTPVDPDAEQSTHSLSIQKAVPSPVAVGDAHLSHRPNIKVGESTQVRLVIRSATGLSSLKKEPVAQKRSSDDPGFVYKLTPRLDLYPWMWAELKGSLANFHVEGEQRQRKPVIPGLPTTWQWQLTPKPGAIGRQDLSVQMGTWLNAQEGQPELEVETAENMSFVLMILPETATPPVAMSALSAESPTERSGNVATILTVLAIIMTGVASLVWVLVRQGRAKNSAN